MIDFLVKSHDHSACDQGVLFFIIVELNKIKSNYVNPLICSPRPSSPPDPEDYINELSPSAPSFTSGVSIFKIIKIL